MNFFYNAGMDVGGWELYSFGSYGVRDANGAGFYRRALDARNADWDNGGAPIYEDGYLPVITSTIHDIAVAGGLRGEAGGRSEENTSGLQALMRHLYAAI